MKYSGWEVDYNAKNSNADSLYLFWGCSSSKMGKMHMLKSSANKLAPFARKNIHGGGGDFEV
jgi:hypothetical protein